MNAWMRVLAAAVFVAVIAVMAGPALADGILIPIGPMPEPGVPIPRPPHTVRLPPLSVKYHRVNVEIRDQAAVIDVDQVFVNEYDRDIEGIYIFPIPETAAIDKFSMWADGKELKGKVLDAQEAKKIYTDIVSRMRDPALLEYAGRNIFKASVYPIPAHGEKRIRLQYTELLPRDQQTVRLLYPLSTEKFSNRPISEVALNVTAKTTVAVENIYSPTHHVSIRRDGAKAFTAGFEEKGVKPDKDFVLYYTLTEDELGMSLLSYRDGADGYFMLLASPKTEKPKAGSFPKNIVFVVDSSGSMRENGKMDQAREAAEFVLRGLGPKDRFNIIDFDNGVSWFRPSLASVEAGTLDEASKFVRDIESSGGTNINGALTAALKALSDADGPGYVLFLTDGEPTVGITDVGEILKNASSANTSRARIFVFGVGFEVNAVFLDQIASQNHGAPQYVKPDEKIEVAVSSLYDKIASPVLSGVALDITGIKAKDVFPAEMPDLFRGTQLVVVGRYAGSGPVKAVLSGKMGEEGRRFTVTADFAEREKENAFLPSIWATRRIAFLLDQIRLNGASRELEDEVRDLGLRYGIVTPYTSFLVTEDEKTEIARRDRGTPSAAPMKDAYFGTDAMPGGMSNAPAEGGRVGGVRGSAAEEREQVVLDSIRLKKGRESSVETRVESQRVKYVKDRTFNLKDGVWIDAQYREKMKLKSVKFASDEYFAILNDHPEIAPYLAAGTRCIIVSGDQAFEITEG